MTTDPADPVGCPIRCEDCPIRHRAVCSDCTIDELAFLDGIKAFRTYAKGEMIAWADEPLTHLGTVVSGVAALTLAFDDGRSQIVGLLMPSDFIGRAERASAAHDVIAATEVTLCRFEKPAFEAFLKNSPTLMARLLAKTGDDLDAARNWMGLLGRKTARERVAGFLSMLVRRAIRSNGLPPEDGMTITIPLPRRDLANYIGLTVETTSRQFTRLRQDSVITMPTQRDIHIPSLATLFREAREL